MANETESIPTEPKLLRYFQRQINEFRMPINAEFEQFRQALVQKDTLRKEQADESARLKVVNPQKLTDEEVENQCKIMLRIAKARGIAVQSLIGSEYGAIKKIETDKIREQTMETLDDYYMPESVKAETGTTDEQEEQEELVESEFDRDVQTYM